MSVVVLETIYLVDALPLHYSLYSSNMRKLIRYSYIYGLLTKCVVKMAGYWPSSFFACFMDQDRVKVHILALAKIERGRYPAILTEQAWSIKDLLYGFQ